MARSVPPGPKRPARDEAGPRRLAREAALQILYGLDAAGTIDRSTADAAIVAYWAHLEGPAEGRAYADTLVRGVAEHATGIDEAIRTANTNWRLERMARVDRTVLRIAAFEILHGEDVPPTVAIDEAVDIAKRFGTADSAAFVNGTLDKVARLNKKLG